VDGKGSEEWLNKRQIDENVVFNLAATRPDLLTGVNPATGHPERTSSVSAALARPLAILQKRERGAKRDRSRVWTGL
jgi:hypothetical protein